MGNTTCHVKDFTKDEIQEQYPCIPDDLTDAQQSQIMAQKVCAPRGSDRGTNQSQIPKTCTVSDLTIDTQTNVLKDFLETPESLLHPQLCGNWIPIITYISARIPTGLGQIGKG